MLRRACVFLILAIAAFVVGFGGAFLATRDVPLPETLRDPVSPGSVVGGLAKLLFVVFLILFVISLLFGKKLSKRHF